MTSLKVLVLCVAVVLVGHPTYAQGPRAVVQVGFSIFGFKDDVAAYWPEEQTRKWFTEHVAVSGRLRLWSHRQVSVAAEASVHVQLPSEAGVCPSVSGIQPYLCGDHRRIGNALRVGLTSRVGKRDGSGAYALASAGVWGASLSGAVDEDGELVKGWEADRVGGLALELGAGTSLPVGDRRTGIEARGGRLGGVRRGWTMQLGLTRRW